jgi:hypothetical protein
MWSRSSPRPFADPEVSMSRTLSSLCLGAAAAVCLLMLLPAPSAADREVQEVRVTNFPATQRVEGRVGVDGPIHQAALASLREIEVPPVAPSEVRRLVPAGIIGTDGFPAVVLSLTGQIKGMLAKPGDVGVILLPDEEPIQRAFEERGQIQFPLEVKAASFSGELYFSSGQPRFVVGFPRYRVFAYNTTDKTAMIDLYAYLTD